jgi:hypothetical protein
MVNIKLLLDRLEDPFEMFPMQSVARDLAELFNRVEKSRFGRASAWGVSPRYYTVEDEHDIEVRQLLIGSVFVLGQAAITQAVSLVKKMHELKGSAQGIPIAKEDIMALESLIHVQSGINKISLINAVANYCKHRYEWWDDWSGPNTSLPTIRAVARLGLSPTGEQNLEIALRAFEMRPDNMTLLCQLIFDWRERLAANLRSRFDMAKQVSSGLIV